jgi:hypothetical protein
MKRKVVVPSKPATRPAGEQAPRERRTLGIKFEVVTGDGVSGLR